MNLHYFLSSLYFLSSKKQVSRKASHSIIRAKIKENQLTILLFLPFGLHLSAIDLIVYHAVCSLSEVFARPLWKIVRNFGESRKEISYQKISIMLY
jgi:hypothetical protein